jgi:mono/diheme cytochrome c family protein
MMKIKSIFTISGALVLMAGLLVTGCNSDKQKAGYEYMPDMYRTPALEPYSGNSNYADSMEARTPAEGTIPRGYLPYGIPNSQEGYEMAGSLLKNPLANNPEIVEEGKIIYSKYCVHCHGAEGAGDGPTVTAGGHPPPPAYNSAALAGLPEGKMFHSITYGKNLMGSHASQLNSEERWKVILYVQTLQNPDGAPMNAESTEAVEPTAVEESVEGNETAMTN